VQVHLQPCSEHWLKPGQSQQSVSSSQLQGVLLDVLVRPRCMQALSASGFVRLLSAAMLPPAVQQQALWRQPISAVPQLINLRDIGGHASRCRELHAGGLQRVSCSSGARCIAASAAVLRQDPAQQQAAVPAAAQQASRA
jgi:hypothetical protein